MSRRHARDRSRGFSLLEVMVSVIVICVGLLGIAKLQALSLSSVTSSRLRALAAIEAAGMASAMHSNRQYWGLTPPGTVTVTGTTVTSSDGALQTAAAAANAGTLCWSPTATTNSGPACGAVQLAAFDLVRWTTSLTTLLPNPAPNPIATILCPPTPGGGPASCTVQISWNEQAVAINLQQAGAAAQCAAQVGLGQQCFEIPTYTLYVEP
jgi:type IV pilus assembly protein PilV